MCTFFPPPPQGQKNANARISALAAYKRPVAAGPHLKAVCAEENFFRLTLMTNPPIPLESFARPLVAQKRCRPRHFSEKSRSAVERLCSRCICQARLVVSARALRFGT